MRSNSSEFVQNIKERTKIWWVNKLSAIVIQLNFHFISLFTWNNGIYKFAWRIYKTSGYIQRSHGQNDSRLTRNTHEHPLRSAIPPLLLKLREREKEKKLLNCGEWQKSGLWRKNEQFKNLEEVDIWSLHRNIGHVRHHVQKKISSISGVHSLRNMMLIRFQFFKCSLEPANFES